MRSTERFQRNRPTPITVRDLRDTKREGNVAKRTSRATRRPKRNDSYRNPSSRNPRTTYRSFLRRRGQYEFAFTRASWTRNEIIFSEFRRDVIVFCIR